MGTIHWRYKNIAILVVIILSTYIVFRYRHVIFHDGLVELIFGENASGPCNKYIREVDDKTAKRWPIIGILGPPGSGELWLRYLIEQLTGIYTGSTGTQYSQLFTAEGKTKKVVAVLVHDVKSLPRMKAGILMYRSMKDTIRSQYAAKHGPGVLLEAPMEAYYGKQWENFAMEQAEKWTEQYDSYIKCNKPLIVISYDQLMDPDQVQKQLIHLSHFLHVPIKQSVLNCLVDKTTEEDLYPQYKPRPLRYGFNPFELLPVDKQHLLQKLENSTEQLVIRTREGFLPRIHV